MTYQDYESRLNSIVSAPDTAPAVVQEVLGEIKTDLDSLSSAQAGIEERDGRIKDLQETNIKLFMSQTGEAESQEEPEEEEKSFEDILNGILEQEEE